MAALAATLGGARAETASRAWTGSAGDGMWDTAGNWEPSGVPAAGDDVTVGAGAAILLTNATPRLGEVALTDAKLLFAEPVRELPANLVAALNADSVHLAGATVVTHVTNTMTVGEWNATGDKIWRIDGRVAVNCTTLTIDAGAKIDVSGCGYCEAKGSTYGGAAGPGGMPNTSYACGGSYGGIGSNAHREGGNTYGSVYGDASDPAWPGSAGGRGRNSGDEGFSGGGLVRLVATGAVTVNGGIRADGAYGWRNSKWNARWGSSGGGVYISAASLAGSGLVTANGLCGETTSYGGGGGRIAVHYNAAAQTAAGMPAIRFSADAPSCSTTTRTAATPGTIWFTDARFVPSVVNGTVAPILAGIVHVGSTENLGISSLTVTGARFGLSDALVAALTLSGGISVSGALGELSLGGDVYLPAHEMTFRYASAKPTISAASFSVSGGAAAHLFSAKTNAANEVGATLAFGDLLTVGKSGVFNVWCHPTNGAIAKLSGVAAEIAAGGTLQSDQAGFIGYANKGWGPGAGSGEYGAGHGGMGPRENNVTCGYRQYDDLEYPCLPGSSGGTGRSNQEGSAGGGVIHLTLTGDLVNNGTISADAKAGSMSDGSGSGSGGTVFVACRSVTGTGAFTATGSGPEGYVTNQGAGGRIAIHYDVSAQGATGPMAFSAAAGAALDTTTSKYNQGDVGGVLADMGTVWLPDAKLLGDGSLVGKGAVYGGELHLGDWTGWKPTHLVVDGGRVRYAIGSYRVDIPGDVVISNRAQFAFGGGAYSMTNSLKRMPYTAGVGPVVNVRGNFTLIHQGNTLSEKYARTTFHLLAGDNIGEPYVGASLTVGKTMSVGANCIVHPMSHPRAGDSPRFRVKNLVVASGGAFDASVRGYESGGPKGGTNGWGPGGGTDGGRGGSYGGYGSAGSASGVAPLYGEACAVFQPGSGAGKHSTTTELPTNGGGLIWIEARRNVTLGGSLLANGGQCTSAGGGTGSGGGVYVRCARWTALDGAVISAQGGIKPHTWSGYVGGGGRVAVFRRVDAGVAVTPNVLRGYNGSGTGGTAMSDSEVAKLPNPDGHEPDARTGSVYWGPNPLTVTRIILR